MDVVKEDMKLVGVRGLESWVEAGDGLCSPLKASGQLLVWAEGFLCVRFQWGSDWRASQSYKSNLNVN